MESFALHGAVERGVNEGDVEGLVGLYEQYARMVREDGSVAVGLDEIRELYRELVGYGGASASRPDRSSRQVTSPC